MLLLALVNIDSDQRVWCKVALPKSRDSWIVEESLQMKVGDEFRSFYDFDVCKYKLKSEFCVDPSFAMD